jgi:predicted branched-subunit amino acid permease
MYVSWQASTWVGIWAGGSVPNPGGWGLDFALPAIFIGMLVPLLRHRSMVLCVAVAGTLSIALHGLPNQFGLIIAVCAGAATGTLSQRLWRPAASPRHTETAAS